MQFPNGVRREAALPQPLPDPNAQLGVHLRQRFPDQDFGDDHDIPPVTEVVFPDPDFVDNDDGNDDTVNIINNLD